LECGAPDFPLLMTKHFALLLGGIFLFVLGAGALCADDARPEAKQLLVSAHEASDLSAILPYELHGAVVINPATSNEKRGYITIYRDHERMRSELRVEDYQEIKLVRGNKLYIYRSTPLPVPMLSLLAETDHAWDKLAEDGDARMSDVSRKKVQNQPANCFDVKGERRHRLCFDPERKVLLESMERQKAIEFSNYSDVDGHWFPKRITVLLELATKETPILAVDDIQVTKAQFAPTAFAVPPHAMEFDTCENMQAAKPVQMPRPEFSPIVARRNAATPAIHVYGIVEKDGSLQNVKMLTTDMELQQSILEALKKWRYAPAMCGASPVASEKEIEIPLFGEFGGSGGEGGRRGR
jgi:Gram-negative bacterial TonB protein C-terminal